MESNGLEGGHLQILEGIQVATKLTEGQRANPVSVQPPFPGTTGELQLNAPLGLSTPVKLNHLEMLMWEYKKQRQSTNLASC